MCKNQEKCKLWHPELCKEFINYGKYHQTNMRGCKNDGSCRYYHPKICASTWKKENCKFPNQCKHIHLNNTGNMNVEKNFSQNPRFYHNQTKSQHQPNTCNKGTLNFLVQDLSRLLMKYQVQG